MTVPIQEPSEEMGAIAGGPGPYPGEELLEVGYDDDLVLPGEELKWWGYGDAGQKVQVKNLRDDHLRNIIFYLNRKYGQVHGTGFTPGAPHKVWGPHSVWYMYNVLRREANRRNLAWI